MCNHLFRRSGISGIVIRQALARYRDKMVMVVEQFLPRRFVQLPEQRVNDLGQAAQVDQANKQDVKRERQGTVGGGRHSPQWQQNGN